MPNYMDSSYFNRPEFLEADRRRRRRGPLIRGETLDYMDWADRTKRRDFTFNQLEPLRNRGYPIAPLGRLSQYDPSQGTIGGMRLPVRETHRLGKFQPGSPRTSGNVGGATTQGGGGKGLPGGLTAGGPQGARPSYAPSSNVSQPGPDYGFTEQYGPLFDLVNTIPEVARQYMSVANRGVYGPEGIQNIVETGIDPARERTQKLTEDVLSYIRQSEGRETQAAARAMAKGLPGQSGRLMKSITGQILAPSLGRQAEIAAKLNAKETEILNQLDLGHAELIRSNMESKMQGLAGLGQTTQQAADLVSRRIFDPTVTAFGFTPERLADVKIKIAKKMAAWGIEADKMGVYWRAFYQNELEKAREDRDDDWFDALLRIGETIGTIYGASQGGG